MNFANWLRNKFRAEGGDSPYHQEILKDVSAHPIWKNGAYEYSITPQPIVHYKAEDSQLDNLSQAVEDEGMLIYLAAEQPPKSLGEMSVKEISEWMESKKKEKPDEDPLDAIYGPKEQTEAKPDLYSLVSDLHGRLSKNAYELWYNKSRDYGSSGDPFANFHTFGSFGILVRLHDKLARLASFEKKGFHAVKDESTEDTILDIMNYAILYLAYRKWGK